MARRERYLKKRLRKKQRRLVDPAPQMNVRGLRHFLRGTRRVHEAELHLWSYVPRQYRDQKPEIMSRNKGVITMLKKMAHLRRRFLFLRIVDGDYIAEGRYIRDKLEVYQREVAVLQTQIEALGGRFIPLPYVFTTEMALLYKYKSLEP